MSRLKLALSSLVMGVLFIPPAGATDKWSVEMKSERSAVTLFERDTTWWTNRGEVAFEREQKGRAYAAGESQRRDGVSDEIFLVGGYRRLGDWTISGHAGVGADTTFLYRYSAEAQISRRLVGTLVGHAAYRYLEFEQVTVHLISPAATLYFPKGEIEARYYSGDNRTLDRDTNAVLLRGLWHAHPRTSFSAGVAVGERIFDIAALAATGSDGWVAFANAQLNVSERNGIRVEFLFAHEDPAFEQRSIGFAYRRIF